MTKELAKMKMYCDFPQARPYSFNFGVDDEYSGVDYTRAESRYISPTVAITISSR